MQVEGHPPRCNWAAEGRTNAGNTHISFLHAWLQVALGHPLSRHYKANSVPFVTVLLCPPKLEGKGKEILFFLSLPAFFLKKMECIRRHT
jgi:hypothetical protein